jgi:hypothetical protein
LHDEDEILSSIVVKNLDTGEVLPLAMAADPGPPRRASEKGRLSK